MKNDNYKILSDLIMKSMSDHSKENEELWRMLSENSCSEELIDNVSSKEYFAHTAQMLDKAFSERKEQELLLKLQKRNLQRKKTRRTLFTISTLAAAVFAISFYLVNIEKEAKLIKPITTSESVKIETPTLIINDSNYIELSGDTKQIIAQNYSKSSIKSNEDRASNQRLIIPYGHTYSVLLEDGTEVLLNANSELIYPSKFGDYERRVELRGEAYFNVQKSDKPFVVQVNKSFVKVFGTSFNINAKDPHLVKTILVEGSVGVGCSESNMTLIQPNQMAIIDIRNDTQMITDVNTDSHLAWREGLFKFFNTDFATMITELENWYGKSFHFNKEVFKDVSVNFSILRTNSLAKNIEFIETLLKIKVTEKGGDYIIERIN